MNVAYVEMIGGASGNMLLGAFVDAGADLKRIESALRTIPIDGWRLERKRVIKCGVAAEYVDFVVSGADGDASAGAHKHEGERGAAQHLDEVLAVLDRSGLAAQQKARAREVYVRLASAEAKVHGTTVDAIHFHEVGAIDAILDVASTCVALDVLEIDELTCSAFPLGHGSIAMSHGRYPNPPPASAELMRGAPTYDAGVDGEMVTTTGAAILTTLVAVPGKRPPMRANRIGYGAGRSDFAIPNVVRISVGPRISAVAAAGHDDAHAAPDDMLASADMMRDEIAVLETNIDDMSPQRFELALERTLAAGAYDVWLAPVTMKKSRPAILFGAIAPLERESAVARAMLAETTTLGVRVRRERRYALPRQIETVETPLGAVRVKAAMLDGARRRTLEYDDVARIARERNMSFAAVAAQLEEHLRPT